MSKPRPAASETGDPLLLTPGLSALCPACLQQGAGSAFLRRLNAGDETPSGPEATESAMTRRTTRIPSSANTPANALDASGSSCEANRERTSMVTREPSREKSCAISRAT